MPWLILSGSWWESLLVAAHSSLWRLPGPAGITSCSPLLPAAGDEGPRKGRVSSLQVLTPGGVNLPLAGDLPGLDPASFHSFCLGSSVSPKYFCIHDLFVWPAVGPRD